MLRALVLLLLLIVDVATVIDWARRPSSYFTSSSARVGWLLVILLVPLLGPFAYAISMMGKPGPVT